MTRKSTSSEETESHPLLRVAGIVFMVIGVAVGMLFGAFAFTRFLGVTAVIVAIVFAFGGGIPIRFGESVVGVLLGWKKAFVCLPLIALGLYTVVNAEKVTCWSSKSKHLCAAKQ
ncbi:hypothetical protein ACQ859_19775 [Roseateles chitinivorans]|uniref:hypothetical protein n=1 Tax=Roseateles chitinivorans TaxID=2917965 RepID=UPI003D66BBC1